MSIGTSAHLAGGDARLVAERLSDRLAARLASQIGAGDLRSGDRLPTEAQLAAAHGVSRTVVREAVHQLRSRGLVRSRQGSGVFVADLEAHRPLEFDPARAWLDRRRRACRRGAPRARERDGGAGGRARDTRAGDRAQARAGRDRCCRRRRARRRRRRPRVPSCHRRGHRQPAVQPAARVPRAVPARGHAHHARQRGAPRATSWTRCVPNTAPSSTPSPRTIPPRRGAAPPSTCVRGQRRLEIGGVIARRDGRK